MALTGPALTGSRYVGRRGLDRGAAARTGKGSWLLTLRRRDVKENGKGQCGSADKCRRWGGRRRQRQL